MKKRFNNLSIYRIVITLLVLQYHVFYILYARAIPFETLLSKGVQGLTCLSGLLYSTKLITNYKKFYLDGVKKIIIPALVCFALMALWNLVYMFITRNWDYISLFVGYRAYNHGLLIQPGNYYYIAYIFAYYLVTPILQKKNKWSVIVASSMVIIELVIGFFFGCAIIMASYLVGYFLGKFLFKQLVDTEEKFNYKHFFLYLATTAISLGLYILLVFYPIHGNYFLERSNSLICNILMTTFGISSFFLIAHALRWTNKYDTPKLFLLTDKISLNIYLFNQAFMCGAMNVAVWVAPMWGKYILVYVFTIGFGIISYYLYKLIFLRKNDKPKLNQANG